QLLDAFAGGTPPEDETDAGAGPHPFFVFEGLAPVELPNTRTRFRAISVPWVARSAAVPDGYDRRLLLHNDGFVRCLARDTSGRSVTFQIPRSLPAAAALWRHSWSASGRALPRRRS